MKAKLVVCCVLVSGLGCSKDKNAAETFVDNYCAEVTKCCAGANLLADGKACRNQWALYALAGPYDAKAGGACLSEVRSQVSAGTFCKSLGRSFPATCAAVYGGGGSGGKQPGDACRYDSDCATSSEGDVVCASANIAGTFVSRCQVRIRGTAGSRPCAGTQEAGGFVNYSDPNAYEVPAKAYVCNLADGIQCWYGNCVALVAVGGPCDLSNACVRSAYCHSGTCTTRIAAGSTCTGGDSAECADGNFCDSSSKQCTGKVANGGRCTDSAMCQSAYCLNNSCAEDQSGLSSACGG
jgi:hypothetical protein